MICLWIRCEFELLGGAGLWFQPKNHWSKAGTPCSLPTWDQQATSLAWNLSWRHTVNCKQRNVM
jgi:hypothetical protein